ncbi:MAG: AAA family ATPase [Polyangiaceae bacterium]
MTTRANVATADPLVGRIAERAQLRRRIIDDKQKLITIWGPGGIGKTRLARELIHDANTLVFSGGIFTCALVSAMRAGDLVAIVARAIGLSASTARSHEDRLARIGRALAARGRTLVLLDNVEQIVAETCAALSAWMMIAPETTFIATSRELLGVSGESPCELAPLNVPRTDAEVETSDAVELLVRRARDVRPDFEADPRTLREIVSRLDGIPLAIELAAARLAVLSARQLALRLDRRFEVLAVRHGGAEARQRTLRGAIDWSWELLDEAEQHALAELSVFHGAFDLDAAEAVLDHPAAAASVIHALRSKSLIVSHPADTPGGAPRFSLFESIRDYSLEKLGDRRSEVQARHAKYFIHAAEERAALVDGLAGEEALRWLTREQPSLVTLVDRYLAENTPQAAELALRAVLALEPMLSIHGANMLVVDLLARIETVCALENFSDAMRLRFLEARASSLLVLGHLQEAGRATGDAQRIAREVGEIHHARVLTIAAYIQQAQGHQEQAMNTAQAALALAEAIGARREQGTSLAYIGLVLHVRDQFSEALVHYERALAIHLEVGHLRAEIRTRARLAFLMQDLGRPEDAIAQCEEARRVEEKLESRQLNGLLLGYIGNFRRAQGRISEARDHYSRAVQLLRRAGDRRFEATFTMDDGIACLLDADHETAATQLALAAKIIDEVGDARLSTLIAGYELMTQAGLGDVEAARAAFDRANAYVASVNDPATQSLLELQAAQLDVASSKHASPKIRERLLARARAIVAQLPKPILGEHRRIAVHLLQRELDQAELTKNTLLVMRDGSKIRPPGSAWVDLVAHPSTQRVLAMLVHRRIASPNASVASADLIEGGWPGEKVVASAAANRLRVLLTWLRTNGLRDLLKSDRGAYWLDSGAPIAIVESEDAHD